MPDEHEPPKERPEDRSPRSPTCAATSRLTHRILRWGAVFTDDNEKATLLRSLAVHGKGNDKYDNVRIGVNSRLDTLQAAILIEKLTIFPQEILVRDRVAARYTAAIAANSGFPQNMQTSWGDSSRAGQWYDGQGYVGVSSPTYGTLTVFRQNSLTLDAVIDYDPFGGSYAFSPIGFQGITCGGGNTENCRNSTSLKYRVNIDHFRVATSWQFGGYDQNNASRGAYQFGVGADIPTRGKDVLSFDAIYSHVRDSVSLTLAPGANDAFGTPIPPFLPQAMTATISDNTAAMFVAKYTTGPLKLFAGYEHIRYATPSDPQTAFTDIAGDFLCQACQAFNNTNISNAAFGVNGLGNRILQIMWIGGKYAVTDNLDVIGGYYHYIQDSFFGTPTGGPAFCSDSSHSQCAGTYDAISAAVDWRFAPKWDAYFGMMFNQVHDGLSFGFLQHSNIDPTVGVRFRF